MCYFTHLSLDLLHCAPSSQHVPEHLKPRGGSTSPLSRKTPKEPPSKCKSPQIVMGETQGKFPGDKLEILLEDIPDGGEYSGCSVVVLRRLALIPVETVLLPPTSLFLGSLNMQ